MVENINFYCRLLLMRNLCKSFRLEEQDHSVRGAYRLFKKVVNISKVYSNPKIILKITDLFFDFVKSNKNYLAIFNKICNKKLKGMKINFNKIKAY